MTIIVIIINFKNGQRVERPGVSAHTGYTDAEHLELCWML